MGRKDANGITLIALVISIIVMLILAGVSLNLTIGDNGILNQAKTAKLKNEEAEVGTEVATAVSSLDIEYYDKANSYAGITIDSIYNIDGLAKYLNGKVNGFNYNKNGTTAVYYTNENGTYTVKIDKQDIATTFSGISLEKGETVKLNMSKSDVINLNDNDGEIFWNISSGTENGNLYGNTFTKTDNGITVIKGYDKNNNVISTIIIEDSNTFAKDDVDLSKSIATVNLGAGSQDDVKAYIFKNTDDSYKMVIKGTGKMEDVPISSKMSSEYVSKMKEIVIDDDVTTIGSGDNSTVLEGEGIFYGFSNVETFTLGKNVEAVRVKTFEGLTGMKTLNYKAKRFFTEYWYSNEETDTVLQKNGFENLNINNIIFSDDVEIISAAVFSFCTNLESIIIGNNVRRIEIAAFYQCKKLKNIYMSDSVEYIGAIAFAECSSLTEFTLPAKLSFLDTSFLLSTFRSDEALKTIYYNAENFTYESVEDTGISPIFRNSKITKLIIGNNVKRIPNASFAFQTELTEIIIPDSVENIEAYAFYNCSNVEKVVLGKGIKELQWTAFRGLQKLKNVEYNITNCSYEGYTADGLSPMFEQVPLLDLKIGENVEKIPEGAFALQTSLTEIVIPNNVKVIEDYAFYGCTGITEITIPSSVTYIGYQVFRNCSNLKTVNYNAKNCTINCIIGNTVYAAFPSNVTQINIGSDVQVIDNAAFSTTSITTITIPSNVQELKHNIGGPFILCDSLTKIIINKPKDSISGAPWSYNSSIIVEWAN